VQSIVCGVLLQTWRGSSVCLSVGHNREPYKTAALIEVPFGCGLGVGLRNLEFVATGSH